VNTKLGLQDIRPRKYEATTWLSLILRLLYGALALWQAGGSLCCSGNMQAPQVDYLYRLVPEVTQSLEIFLTCLPTSLGKYLINGSRYMVYSVWSEYLYIHHMESAGDMVFFKLLGQPFLLLGSAERAYDIFEKRSSNYSDRPRLPMLNEVSVTSLYQ